MTINLKKAVFFILISSFSFSVMQLCVKLSGTTIPLMQQMFFRNLITLFLSTFIIFKEKGSFFGKREHRKYLFLRAFLGFTSVSGYFYATNHMYLADASIIQYSSPIFISIFTAMLYRKKPTNAKILSICVAFLGAILVVRPKFSSESIPAMISLVSSMITAMSHMALTVANRYEKPYTIVFFFSLFSTLCSLPFMMMDFVLPDMREALLLFCIGLFAGMGQIFLTYAYKNAPASKVSIYSYTGVIFSSIYSVTVFGKMLGLYSIIGIVLIFSSALFDYLTQQSSTEITTWYKRFTKK